VSENELNRQIADLTREKFEADHGVAALEGELAQIAKRFDELGSNIKRYLNRRESDDERRPNVRFDHDDILRKSLDFGPDSGITIDGLVDRMRKRDQLIRRIDEINIQIRRLS